MKYLSHLIFNENIFHIAKSDNWNKDIYDDYLALELKTSCMVETWMKNGLSSTLKTKNIW